ncbi:hypothetical protein BS47DRAFT_1355891, partial [Hydnum rufescens UP504]
LDYRITRRKPYPKGTVLPPDDMAAPFDKTSDPYWDDFAGPGILHCKPESYDA